MVKVCVGKRGGGLSVPELSVKIKVCHIRAGKDEGGGGWSLVFQSCG